MPRPGFPAEFRMTLIEPTPREFSRKIPRSSAESRARTGALALIFNRLPKQGSFEHIRVAMVSKWLMTAEYEDAATIIALTSRSSGEGVTTVAAGLARAFGRTDPGNVLVFDAAPSRLRIGDLLIGQTNHVGLFNLESGSLDQPISVACDSKHGVDILALSEIGYFRSDSATKATSLVERLRWNYRVILVDAGPLSKDWAAHWLAYSTYRVLVVDASMATREVLEYQRKQLEQEGFSLDGSILNKRPYPIPKALYWLAR